MRLERKFIFKLVFISSIITYLIVNYKLSYRIRVEIVREPCSKVEASKLNSIYTRDFYSYGCKNRKRIGGAGFFVRNTNDPLWRIDGAWFLCFDGSLPPVENECNVLSFGVNHDYTFDQEMSEKYKCIVHSFDPFIETDKFKHIRESESQLADSISLNVTDRWKFHRLGLTGDNKIGASQLEMKDKLILKDILKYTDLVNKVIDVVKIDIEGEEQSVLMNFDIDYACKYFKQLVLETHATLGLDAIKYLRVLEKCFYLFHRDTRFFIGDTYGPTGYLTEFQNWKGYKLDLSLFDNEIILANYMFSMGELYFVNENFL